MISRVMCVSHAFASFSALLTRILQDYALLFGMIYGTAEQGPTAYNWYLTQDLEALVFFDAKSGTEYTTAGLEKKGFKPSFATF